MSRNNIRALRESCGIDAKTIAKKIGHSLPQQYRIENGKRRLTMELASRYAEIFGVSVYEVFGLDVDQKTGIAEDVNVYTPDEGDLVHSMLVGNPALKAYKVLSNALDRLGIFPGSILIADTSASALSSLEPLQILIAHIKDQDDPSEPTLIARQFVPPSLLITNSKAENEMPIDISDGDVKQLAVVKSVHTPVPGLTAANPQKN